LTHQHPKYSSTDSLVSQTSTVRYEQGFEENLRTHLTVALTEPDGYLTDLNELRRLNYPSRGHGYEFDAFF
jgi:hypothetical protein